VEVAHATSLGMGCLKNPWNGHGILFPRKGAQIVIQKSKKRIYSK
jgi:hypothetical protein